jgi:hypothetical protein
MTKFDKELTSQIEEAIKFLENTPCKHPGLSKNKLKSINEFVRKQIKKFNESKK